MSTQPWSRTIFRLLLQDVEQMMGNTAKEHHLHAATSRWLTVEPWHRRQHLISVRQNQIQ
jgi:hypothetical protein